MGRTAIIGVDGAPYRLMDRFSDEGHMPNFRELKAGDHFYEMDTVIPPVSSLSWSSMITGTNPGEHGVYGFTDLVDGTYTVSFPDARALKRSPYWRRGDGRHVVLNVPSTYPARELDGVHVSGFVSPDLERAVYPGSLLPELEGMAYRVDVDSGKAHESLRLFLEDLEDTLEKRIRLYRRLQEEDWDVFTLVFTGSDRLGHFLWDAYEDEGHEHREAFVRYFERVDGVIGEVAERLGDDDRLAILSDHGMERIETNLYINAHLEDEGYLNLEGDSLGDIAEGTKAFAMDPGRIYLHREDRYPRGEVTDEEAEGVVGELVESLESLDHGGEPAIDRVYRRDEIYTGPAMGDAPDLVAMPRSGIRIRGPPGADEVFGEDVFRGKHTYDDAFLLMKNPAREPEGKPAIQNVLRYLDLEGEET